MAKFIQVICGAVGVKIEDGPGKIRYETKTSKDNPFEVDDARAAQLVGDGLAKYVDEPVKTEAVVESENDGPALDEMDYNALKALAAEMGVTPEGKRKDDYIAAIKKAKEAQELDEEEEDELPDLNVADPE